jgi:hypothetical protein
MFLIFSKEKIISYIVSLSTVALLFVMSFAITNRNDKIIKVSANTYAATEENTIINSNTCENITKLLQK